MFDTLLVNARIIDGTGNPWFHGDIAIKDKRIAQVGKLQAEAAHSLDVEGKVVCPGFIDIHSHTDLDILTCAHPQNMVQQGVTTEVTGNCGQSMAPVREGTIDQLKQYLGLSSRNLNWDWSTLSEYWAEVERQGLLTNVAPLVGQGTLRNAVMGFDQRKPEVEELIAMKNLLHVEMEQGAFGLSSGLIYPPGLFSQPEEIIELARVVREFDGVYATHIRSETGNLFEACEEAVHVGQSSGVKVQISHHKACGFDNWGKVAQTLELIEAARQSGVDVTCDQYPYLAACTHLSAFLPPWAHEGGVSALLKRLQTPEDRALLKSYIENRNDWENGIKQVGWDRVVISEVIREEDKSLEGKTLQEIVAETQADPFDCLFDLLLRNQADVRIFSFGVCEEDLCRVLKHPCTMVGTDGTAVPLRPAAQPHPRNYGVYPKILGEYVRQKKILPIQEAVRKMTSFPAQKIGLQDRGLLRTGYWADLVVFDPDMVIDSAGYTGEEWRPQGIHMVMVNGEVVVQGGEITGRRPGIVLKHGFSV